MTSVTAFFSMYSGEAFDKACRSIFEAHGGKIIGSGTFLPTGERDIQCDVPDESVSKVKAALKKAGFRLSSTAEKAA